MHFNNITGGSRIISRRLAESVVSSESDGRKRMCKRAAKSYSGDKAYDSAILCRIRNRCAARVRNCCHSHTKDKKPSIVFFAVAKLTYLIKAGMAVQKKFE